MTDADPLAPEISTAAIEMLALECDAEAREWASMQLEPMFERIAASLRALAAERDAHAAEIERLRAERDEFEAMAIRAATIAQEQRALAELKGGKDE